MKDFIDIEIKYGANNYDPLPVVLEFGDGVYVWDIERHRYLDFLSAYSVQNFGHNHPRILAKVINHLNCLKINVSSRAFRAKDWILFAEKICKFFDAKMVLPMNSGAEGVEVAIKIARKWGNIVKGIKDGQQKIIVCDGNFHGRTITIISFSPNKQYRNGFGPLTPGFISIPFGNIEAFKEVMNTKGVVAFLVEPIQGEGGMNVPSMDYFKKIKDLCWKKNIILILDEIQTGMGRTGNNLAEEWFGIMADITILGKALGGGILPISVVLDRRGDIMSVLEPGDHGSTFGGNSLACAVGSESLDILKEENLAEKAKYLGQFMRDLLGKIKSPLIKEVRGLGLANGLELTIPARPVCELLMKHGILCYYTKKNILRLTPPLIIKKDQIEDSVNSINCVLKSMEE